MLELDPLEELDELLLLDLEGGFDMLFVAELRLLLLLRGVYDFPEERELLELLLGLYPELLRRLDLLGGEYRLFVLLGRVTLDRGFVLIFGFCTDCRVFLGIVFILILLRSVVLRSELLFR